jgi:hypothetical protein
MANIGLYIELKDGVFKKSNRELLSLARKSGQNIHAVIFCADLQPYLPELQGIQTVVQVKGPALTWPTSSPSSNWLHFAAFFRPKARTCSRAWPPRPKPAWSMTAWPLIWAPTKPSNRCIRASCWPNTRSTTK